MNSKECAKVPVKDARASENKVDINFISGEELTENKIYHDHKGPFHINQININPGDLDESRRAGADRKLKMITMNVFDKSRHSNLGLWERRGESKIPDNFSTRPPLSPEMFVQR